MSDWPKSSDIDVQEFTATGAFTWVLPTGWASASLEINLQAAGGGGAGGGGCVTTSGFSGGGGGGGGAGEYRRVFIPVVSANLSGTIGTGGTKGTGGPAGGNNGNNGSAGGNTSITAGNTIYSVLGGNGGTGGVAGGNPGTGGAGATENLPVGVTVTNSADKFSPLGVVALAGGRGADGNGLNATNSECIIGYIASPSLAGTHGFGGAGASSKYGPGGSGANGPTNANGNAASAANSDAYGVGGGGGSAGDNSGSTGTKSGGNGADGIKGYTIIFSKRVN